MDVYTAIEWTYKSGYEAEIRKFSEELIEHFNALEYNPNTPRKTVKVDELRAQMDWMLHEVVTDTIKEFAEKYIEEVAKN